MTPLQVIFQRAYGTADQMAFYGKELLDAVERGDYDGSDLRNLKAAIEDWKELTK